MRGRQRSVLGAAPALAVLGVVAAFLAVTDPESRIAVPLLATLGLIATMALARAQDEDEVRTFLRDLMLLGVGARLLLFALIHQTVGAYVFAPDQHAYERMGAAIASALAGQSAFPGAIAEGVQVAFPWMNALAITAFGNANEVMPMINLFLSVWVAVPAYHLGLLLVRGNHGVARWTAGLATFFPSLMLWSVLNIRESPTIFLVVICVFLFARFQIKASLWDLMGAIVCLLLIMLFRQYIMALVAAGAGAGVLMGKSRSPARSLLLGSVVLMAFAFAAQRLGLAGNLADDRSLETLQYLRQDMARGAGSAYGAGADVSTVGGAASFLPVGLAYFLFAPFPWEVSSSLEMITLPETLVWYTIIPFTFWGLWLSIRHDLRRFTVPLATLITVTFAYALVEGNVGTAYRHRAQILPLIFLFSAIGIRDVWALHVARKQRGGRRRRQASRLQTQPESASRGPPHPHGGRN